MRLATLPFYDRLAASRSILIAGAGGGFDVFAGLPLYFSLKDAGKRVHLANLSFTNLAEVRAAAVAPHVLEVRSESIGPEHYFPELALSRWFKAQGEDVPVYAFDKVGGAPLSAAYRALEARLEIDTVLLVDGGTDLLMRGDEAGLGTPQEDITSLAACRDSVARGAALPLPRRCGEDGNGIPSFSVHRGVPEWQRAATVDGHSRLNRRSAALAPGSERSV